MRFFASGRSFGILRDLICYLDHVDSFVLRWSAGYPRVRGVRPARDEQVFSCSSRRFQRCVKHHFPVVNRSQAPEKRKKNLKGLRPSHSDLGPISGRTPRWSGPPVPAGPEPTEGPRRPPIWLPGLPISTIEGVVRLSLASRIRFTVRATVRNNQVDRPPPGAHEHPPPAPDQSICRLMTYTDTLVVCVYGYVDSARLCLRIL